MKHFSIMWRGSNKPKKQRKYRHNAPLHLKKRMLKAHLSKELRTKYKKRSFGLRVGDKVKVVRGRFKGKGGTVKEVNLRILKVSINSIELTKNDGTKVFPMFEPSNLQIVDLKLDDKLRKKAIER